MSIRSDSTGIMLANESQCAGWGGGDPHNTVPTLHADAAELVSACVYVGVSAQHERGARAHDEQSESALKCAVK